LTDKKIDNKNAVRLKISVVEPGRRFGHRTLALQIHQMGGVLGGRLGDADEFPTVPPYLIEELLEEQDLGGVLHVELSD
jgi:hypothetical protein